MRLTKALIIVAFSLCCLVLLLTFVGARETKRGNNKDDCDKCGPTRLIGCRSGRCYYKCIRRCLGKDNKFYYVVILDLEDSNAKPTGNRLLPSSSITPDGRSQEQQQQLTDGLLSACVDKLKISAQCDEPRAKLSSWLGRPFKIVITDERVMVGYFVCTDRDGNVILENTWECSAQSSGAEKQEPRFLGLALVPGKHIVSVSLMRKV